MAALRPGRHFTAGRSLDAAGTRGSHATDGVLKPILILLNGKVATAGRMVNSLTSKVVSAKKMTGVDSASRHAAGRYGVWASHVDCTASTSRQSSMTQTETCGSGSAGNFGASNHSAIEAGMGKGRPDVCHVADKKGFPAEARVTIARKPSSMAQAGESTNTGF